MVIGGVTPSVGVSLHLVTGMAETPPARSCRHVWLHAAVTIAVRLLITWVPVPVEEGRR